MKFFEGKCIFWKIYEILDNFLSNNFFGKIEHMSCDQPFLVEVGTELKTLCVCVYIYIYIYNSSVYQNFTTTRDGHKYSRIY